MIREKFQSVKEKVNLKPLKMKNFISNLSPEEKVEVVTPITNNKRIRNSLVYSA